MPQKKKSKRKSSVQDNSKMGLVKISAISALVSTAVFFLLVLVFCAVVTKKDVSPSVVSVMPFFACALAGFIGGKMIAKGSGKTKLIQSVLSSVFVIFVISIVLFLTVGTIGLRTLAAFGTVLLFYVIGAFLKVRRKPKRKI